MNQEQVRSNGHEEPENSFGIQGKSRDGAERPHSELDIYQQAISPPVGDPLLEQSNLGLGNLTETQFWMQVQSYEDVIYAQTFGDYLIDLGKWTAKAELGREGWRWFDERTEEYREHDPVDDAETADRAEVRDRGDHIWELLDDDQRVKVLDEYGGVSGQFLSAFWRMLVMRNEASRSKNAQLLDNAFGRVSEKEVSGDIGEPQGRLQLGGGR